MLNQKKNNKNIVNKKHYWYNDKGGKNIWKEKKWEN